MGNSCDCDQKFTKANHKATSNKVSLPDISYTAVDQEETKESVEYQAACGEEARRREKELDDISKCVKEDQSHENILLQFSRLLNADGVNVELVAKMIKKVL